MGARSKWLRFIIVFDACTTTYAFFFSWTEPIECNTMNITWSGGVPPYNLSLVVEKYEEYIFQIPSEASALSFKLNFQEGTNMIMTMSDSTGYASGGVSEILVVKAGQSPTCLDPPYAHPTFFATTTPLQQCAPFTIDVDKVEWPVVIRGFIPGVKAFTLNDTTNPVQWTANVRAGTSMIFTAGDSSTGRTGATTDFLTVADNTDASCLDPNASSSMASSSAMTTTNTQSTANTQSTSQIPQAPASSSSGLSRNSLVGVVVGAVVGGLIILAAVWALRFRRKGSSDGRIVDLADGADTPTPGIYEPGPLSPRGSTSHQPTAITSWIPPGASNPDAASSSQVAVAAAGPSLMRQLSTTSASLPTMYIVHTDAEDVRRNVVELPPQYDERQSSGLLDVPGNAPADGSSSSALVTPSEKDVLVLSPPTDP